MTDRPSRRVPIEAEIDLHAFAPRDVESLVEEYVNAASEAGFTEVRLVHGRGRGVQRGIVQAALDRHPPLHPPFQSSLSSFSPWFSRM